MDSDERKARAQDRDRRVIEAAAMLALLPLLGAASDHAAQALRLGVDPVAAMSAVVSGSERLHQPGVGSILASAAVTAWLAGYYRSRAEAVTVRGPSRASAIVQAIAETPDLLRPAAKHADVISRLVDGVGGRDVVQQRYTVAAARAKPIVANIETRLARRLNQITVTGSAMPYTPRGLTHTPPVIADAMRQARLSFDRTGLGNRTSWYVEGRHPAAGEPNVSANAETIIESFVGIGYDDGRGAGHAAEAETSSPPPAAEPADPLTPDAPGEKRTKPKLWGFTWSSVIDGRLCKYCRRLHGMTAPVGDSVWQVLRPIIHHGCRCSRIDRYLAPGQAAPLIVKPDLSEPDVAEAVRMRQALLSWWQGLPTA